MYSLLRAVSGLRCLHRCRTVSAGRAGLCWAEEAEASRGSEEASWADTRAGGSDGGWWELDYEGSPLIHLGSRTITLTYTHKHKHKQQHHHSSFEFATL